MASGYKTDLKIAGWQKVSLIDYPGKIASVIFLAGCNMCCHYCHNHHILNAQQNRVSFLSVLRELEQRRTWIDAVVVSGGEPTIYPGLVELLKHLKQFGFAVKLDTNGTRPEIIREIVEQGLVDYVALDVKAPAGKYRLITGVPINTVLQAVGYLKGQKYVKYQLRTTLSPYLNQNDLHEMGEKIIRGANFWQIQQCRCANAYASAEVVKMAAQLNQYARYVVVKGI